MRVYRLTNLGERTADTARGQDTSSWRVLYHLRACNKASSDDLKGIGATEADLVKLKRPPALIEEDRI